MTGNRKVTFLLVIGLSTLTITDTFAQKLYIWKPKEIIPAQRHLFSEHDTVDVIIFDGRNIPDNSKSEASSEDVISSIYDYISRSYPFCNMRLLPSDHYYTGARDGHATIKIGIAAYHAAFGTDIKIGIGSVGGHFSYGIFPSGKWNALTSYLIGIYDYRENTKEPVSKEIIEQSSEPNTLGYRSARKALNETYEKATLSLVNFIDGSLL